MAQSFEQDSEIHVPEYLADLVPEIMLADHLEHSRLQELGRHVTKPLSIVLAGLALVGSGEVVSQPDAEAAIPLIQNHTMNPHPVRSPKINKCTPQHQIQFDLVAQKNINSTKAGFTFSVDSCRSPNPKVYKNIRIEEQGPVNQRMHQTVKRIDEKHHSYIKFAAKLPPVPSPDSKPRPHQNEITLDAFTHKHKLLGHSKWKLVYVPGVKPYTEGSFVAQKEPEGPCNPSKDFAIGIQDDNQFILQKDMKREDALDIATSIFGSTVLRMNMVYGQVRQYGMQPYIDAVEAATKRGYKVDITLVPTPSYRSDLDQALNFQNLDPDLMQSFAQEVATVLGPKVAMYSIGNEVNHPYFNESMSMQKSNAMYRAGRLGVLSVDPGAKILAGELAPGSIPEWITNLNTLPNDGIAIHPYGNALYETSNYAHQAKTPLYLTEYGNPASDPNQLGDDLSAIEVARCGGARQLLFYQLVRSNTDWNTGVIERP